MSTSELERKAERSLDNLIDALVEGIMEAPDEEVLIEALSEAFAKIKARALAAEAKLALLAKIFAPVFKNFGPEWEDGTGLEVVLNSPDDEDGDEGTSGRCDFTLGQLRRALQKDTAP